MKQVVVFTVNEEEFGVDIESVNSIEQMMDIFKIPNTPEYIEGLINLRGKVHTVINLRKRFHIPDQEFTESNKIIIVKTSASVVGIIVDSVKQIIKVDDDNMVEAPKALSHIKDRFISSIAKTGERIVMLLDLEKVLTVDDLAEAVN